MSKFDKLSYDKIIKAISENNSYRSILISLGLTSNEYNRNKLKLFIKNNKISFSSKNGGLQSPLKIITKEELEVLVKSSRTYKEVLEKLGYSQPCNGPYDTLKSKISFWGINTSHMTHFKKCSNERATDDTIFSENSPHSHSTIRNYVIRHKCIPYKCVYCGNTGEWMGKPLALTLDHKNGNRNDNRIKNLQFVCPNCDRQQATYGSKNRVRYYS